MSDKSSAPRARQACEPCRRKKTKCPGEKPVCSFCQRLGQKCSYERTGDASARINKARSTDLHDDQPSKDRIHRLESRVEEIFDILNGFVNSTSEASSPPAATQSDSRERPTSRIPADQGLDTTQSVESWNGISILSKPPNDVWPILITIYRTKFDCQPMPKLNLENGVSSIANWPQCLLYSFLSITVPFVTTHAFYAGRHQEAISLYSSSARQEIFKHVADGDISLEVLQSTCISALREITASNSRAAWMMISTGIRLALSFGVISRKQESKLIPDCDIRNQICWDLFVLDRMYCSTLTIPVVLSTEELLPDYPTSATDTAPVDQLSSQTSAIKDIGVHAYSLQLFSIWGSAMSYVRRVKDGESEDAWSSQSQYHEVSTRLFIFETKFAQIHRFQQNRFQDLELEVLEHRRDYWVQWLLMQFLFHAVQGLINHPFLQIASRSKRQGFQPPSFLQNSVDQAVLHSSWILKLIEVCDERSFRVNNPFIGHLVAVTATIYLFLLSAKDPELAAQARLGFDSSYNYIRSLSNDWPHLQHTIDKLDILQRAANTDTAISTSTSAPKAQRSLLWELLDYSASTAPSRVPEFATDAVDLNVDTRFLSPLNPLSTGHTPNAVAQPNGQHPLNANETPIDSAIWDPAFDSFGVNLFDNEQMADLANSTFARDMWNFGQL